MTSFDICWAGSQPQHQNQQHMICHHSSQLNSIVPCILPTIHHPADMYGGNLTPLSHYSYFSIQLQVFVNHFWHFFSPFFLFLCVNEYEYSIFPKCKKNLISWLLSRSSRFTDKDSVQSRTQWTMEEEVCPIAFHNIDLQDEDLTLAVDNYNINLPRGQPSIQVQFQIHLRDSNWNNIYSDFEFRKFNKSIKSKFEDISKIQVIIFIKYQM